ncbi:MAG: selenium-dependent xanthine dehydrogenase [Planctomycetota bacterium]
MTRQVDTHIRRQVNFTLNGGETAVLADEDASLLDVLRDHLGITSPKNGCAPQGQCGCCTVLIDGKPERSCTLSAIHAEGKQITTCEGLSDEIRAHLAAAFVEAGGIQCGFCIPGLALRAAALIMRQPNPTRGEIAHAIRRHLCRCTGYVKIIDAIERYARLRRGESMPRHDTYGRVGTRLPRYAAAEAVLGDRPFVDDLSVEDLAFAAPVFAEHPRALLKGVDGTAAAAMPGVMRIITAEDVPGDRYVGLITRDWPVLVAVGEETRCVGDMVALVVARSMRTARAAAKKVHVDYEAREPLTDPLAALRPDAPKIHPGGNLLSRSAIVRGDVARALAGSAHVVEHEFTTQRVEHLYLEPEACLAVPTSDGGIDIFSQGQGVFDDRRQIASVLDMPADKLYVELVSNGGAFGGKEDMSIQAQTALAAWICELPVKMTLTRDESFRLHPKRHPMRLRYKVGCDADGRLTAVHARIIGDTGAYASVGAKVLERSAGHACGPYRVPNVDLQALAVYTNNPPSGAMRGFGVCQVAFAIEACLDMLSEKVGIDRWEIRWRNALDLGDVLTTGQRMTKPFGLKKTLLAVKDQYQSAKFAGIACGIKNVGIGNGMPDEGKAVLTVEKDGTITIRTGFTEMGQGLFTVLIQTAVEETGLPPSAFRAATDTSVSVGTGQTTASRGTVLGCHAVKAACARLKADLAAGKTSADLVGRQYRGEWAYTETVELGADVEDPKTHLTYGFATQVVILDDDGKLRNVIAAHDVGRVMNPTLAEGQIEGAIHMGLGYALTEDFACEGGHVQAKDINACGVLRAPDMPEVEVLLIEEPDPDCPYGAKGIGEIGLVPTAAAVHGALYAYDGVRRFSLPMKDAPAARAIWDPHWKPTRIRET